MQQKEEKKALPLTIGLDAYLDFGVEVDLVMVPCYWYLMWTWHQKFIKLEGENINFMIIKHKKTHRLVLAHVKDYTLNIKCGVGFRRKC